MPLIINTPYRAALLAEIQKITDSIGTANDRFGGDIALSGDGSTLAIGAWSNGTGRVLVYTWNGSSFDHQDTLTPSNGQTLQEFGQHVDINTDGDYIIVGADAYDGPNNNEGRGYVFHRSGGSPAWAEQDILIASDAALSDALGPCSISGAGDIVVMGAQNADAGASNSGAAYVFTRSGTVWTQATKLVDPTPTTNGRMGIDVDISRDGSTIAVGVYAFGETTLGKALIFVAPGWTHEDTLQGADVVLDDDFGRSVSLSASGDTAVVGSYSDDVSGNANAGSAYIFDRTGVSWSETQKLIASDPQLNARLGGRVDMNDAGTKCIVGATGWDEGGQTDNGAAYVFSLSGSWAQTQKLLPTDVLLSKFFGSGVSGGSDFSTIAVGAQGDTISAQANQGSTYIFK